MKGFSVGTKRMWLRRLLKLGDGIAFVLSCLWTGFVSILEFLLEYFFTILITLIISAFVAICTVKIVMDVQGDKIATPEDLQEAGKVYCVAEVLPRRAAQRPTQPLKIKDIKLAQSDCEKVLTDAAAKKVVSEQVNVLKQALPVKK